MIRSRPRPGALFPAGLYASLLVALLCLVRPDAARRVQSALTSVACLPLKGVVRLETSAPVSTQPNGSAAHRRTLAERVDATGTRSVSQVPARWVPRVVDVIERRSARSGGVDELVLETPAAHDGERASFVTVGDALVGFLAPPSVDPDDPLRAHARVRLLSHVPKKGAPRRVPAAVFRGDEELRFLVEPAASIDLWPLRCALLSDPYRAANLSAARAEVRTTWLRDDPFGPLPDSLAIGRLRIYGYRHGDRSLPIGLYVEPRHAPETISRVVVWETYDTRPLGELAAEVRMPAQLVRLPSTSAAGERWLIVGDATFRAGAGVLQGDRLIGRLDKAGRGFGVVAPIGEPGRRWSLTVIPDGRGDPIDVDVEAVGRSGPIAAFRLRAGEIEFGPGQVFVGCVGRDVPVGTWLGPTDGTTEDLFAVRHGEPGRQVEVFERGGLR